MFETKKLRMVPIDALKLHASNLLFNGFDTIDIEANAPNFAAREQQTKIIFSMHGNRNDIQTPHTKRSNYRSK